MLTGEVFAVAMFPLTGPLSALRVHQSTMMLAPGTEKLGPHLLGITLWTETPVG